LPVIVTKGLTKHYGTTTALSEVDLEIDEGTIFGFLGANGAGKTTLIRLLLGLIRPTAGKAWVLGKEVCLTNPELRRKIGYLPGELRLYEDMRGSQVLRFLGRFYGLKDTVIRDHLIETLELPPSALRTPVKKYSRGMKQKLGIIQAFQHDPDLLILDEPTEGLDPLIQRRFYEVLRDWRERGKTIFMSSHNLGEVERVCERVGIIRQGRLVADERIEDLQAKLVHHVEVVLEQPAGDGIFDIPGVDVVFSNGQRAELKVRGDLNPLLSTLARTNVSDLSVQRASLEDIFLEFYREESARCSTPT